MKSIYISLPIKGHEDTYEQRLDEAVEYVKAKYPEYNRIITPKEMADKLDDYYSLGYGIMPSYADYLLNDIEEIVHCNAIFLCHGWNESKGCLAEHAFAEAIGLEILYLP